MTISKPEHYSKLEDINKKLNLNDQSRLKDVLEDTRLNLHRDLGEDKFLLVDGADTIKKLHNIHQRLEDESKEGSILKQIDEDIKTGETALQKLEEIAKAKSGGGKGGGGGDSSAIINQTKEVENLKKYRSAIKGNVDARRKEYKQLYDNAKKFEKKVDKKYFDFGSGSEVGTIKIADATGKTYSNELKEQFVGSATPKDMKFILVDKEGKELEKKEGQYVITLKKIGGEEQKVVVKPDAGKLLDSKTGTLDFKSLKLYEEKTEDKIGDEIKYDDFDFSSAIELTVLGTIPGDLTVGHSKDIKFKFDNEHVTKRLDSDDQKDRYEDYNIAGKPIREYVIDHYKNHYKEIENKLIDDEIGDAIPNEKKQILRDHIRSLIVAGDAFSPFVPIARQGLVLGDGFKTFFFKNVKPTDEDIKSEANYDKFLKKNIPEQLKLFMDKELTKQLESTSPSATTRDLHTPLTRAILKFRQEQEANAKDERGAADALKGATKPAKTNKALNKKRKPEITRSGLWGIMGKKDVSYLRFFHNQSESIGKQTVNIVTDEKDNKVENASYTGEIKVSTNHLQFTINQEGEEPFTLQGGDQVKLIHAILNEPRIKYGKMRIHMAYGLIKALVKLANKNNLTLQYLQKGTNILTALKLDKDENILLENRDDSTGRTSSTSLFSEKEFATNNDIHHLRAGLENCMEHVNKVMNKVHKQYKAATEKQLLSYFSLTRSRFPSSRLTSPLKKLINIRSARTLNFDFEGVNIPGTSYSVSFKKNKYTISGAELKKPISGRHLGKLLRHREIGKRIFDGVELKITSTVYKQTIIQLRKNAKLANTNFGVKDTIKNRVYFINTTGDVCYVTLVNNANPIKRKFTSLWTHKEYGEIKKNTPSTVASAQESEEFYQNPFLMGKLMKAMNLGLYKF